MARKISVELVGDASSLQRAFRRSSESSKKFGRDMSSAGTHAHKFRSHLAFAVGGLIGAGSIVEGLEHSVHAAMDLQGATVRMDAAFKASHVSVRRYAARIREADAAGVKLGFTSVDTRNALGSFVVATHSGGKALRLLSVAQDISRFKHTDLTAAAKMLSMAMAGSQRATKQLGLTVAASTTQQDKAKVAYHAQIDALNKEYDAKGKLTEKEKEQYSARKNTIDTAYAAAKAIAVLNDKSVTSQKVIDLVTKKLHGQAKAFSQTAAGAQARFRAALHETEATIGMALLPTLTKVASKLAVYLTKLNESGKLQRYVRQVTRALAEAFKDARHIIAVLAPKVQALSHALGGNRRAIHLLIGALIAYKAVKIGSSVAGTAVAFGRMAGSIGRAGKAARLARGSSMGLSAGLIGKGGLVLAAGAAAFAITTLILHVTGLDKKLRHAGGAAYGLAAKLGLVKDPMKQWAGKVVDLGPKGALRARAALGKLEAGGLTPQQAAAAYVRKHPNVALHDAQVLAGVYSPSVAKRDIVIYLQMDGKTIAKHTTKHQHRHNKRNTKPRSGR